MLITVGSLVAATITMSVAHAQQAQQASTTVVTAGTASKKVLYVTRLAHRDRAMDDKVRAYLEKRGMTVTMVNEDISPDAAQGEDLVIISSVVSARDMTGTGFKNVCVPLVTWESDLFDSLRLTGSRKDEDFGEIKKEHYINVVNAPSSLAGGVPAGKRWVYPRDQEMGWGRPAPGATVIATVPGEPQHAVVFAYEKGTTMDYDFIAPARRVALFLGNTTFDSLSTDGSALFDAAIDWAVSGPAPAGHCS